MNSVELEPRQEQILNELMNESDRGCILVGASVLDSFLEDLIRIKFSTDSHIVKHAVNPLFEPMGPLSSFSAKIKIAYAFKLISSDMFSDLNKIRKLRNVAAHNFSPKSFENEDVISTTKTLVGADHVVNLVDWEKVAVKRSKTSKTPKRHKTSKERMRFTFTVCYLAGSLEGMFVGLASLKKRRQKA